MRLLGRILRAGRIAEATPTSGDPTGPDRPTGAVRVTSDRTLPLAPSVQVRHVDAGSCNDCELELVSAFGPVYDAERYGVRLVASPRHADALTVSGPVTHNMVQALLQTYEAIPSPKRVIALGDGAIDCGAFAGAHGVAGPVSDFIPVDIEVRGDPPSPEDIVVALRLLTGR